MGYRHIDNLYKNQDILLFKECFVSEKIHGTSAHISWRDSKVSFYSGGVEHLSFLNLFDIDDLVKRFIKIGRDKVIIYGEAYGGKCQGMSAIYGKELRFVAFEVKIGKMWLRVPDAEGVVKSLDLDFVSYVKCTTDIEELNKQRDLPSVQARKNGIVDPKKREGIVLRPFIELRKNNNERIISKHKNDDFIETKTPRDISEKDFKVLEQANDIAEEWVTEMRLSHVLDQFPNAGIEKTGDIIRAMVEDVERESEGEIIKSRAARKAISRRVANMFKDRLKDRLNVL